MGVVVYEGLAEVLTIPLRITMTVSVMPCEDLFPLLTYAGCESDCATPHLG